MSGSDGYYEPRQKKQRTVWLIAGCFVLSIAAILLWSLHIFSNSGALFAGRTANLRPIAESQTGIFHLTSESALEELVGRGRPILGDTPIHCDTSAPTCNWMSKVPDATKLVRMNLPGTHDTATWNYSDARQAELERYTGKLPPARAFRCQQRPIFQMLNDGIRVFDLRYAYNPGNDTIGFYHSVALLAPTTSIIDVLYGFYHWIENHPSETILLSFNHEAGSGTVEDERLQTMIYDIFSRATGKTILSNRMKRAFWIQGRGELGTLGEARGKILLLQRFSYGKMREPPHHSKLTGLDVAADRWTDNGDDIRLVYNPETNGTVFIEDRYFITLPPGTPSTIDAYISAKFRYTTAHLDKAIATEGERVDQLSWTFASAAFRQDPNSDLAMYPNTYALGEGGVLGMNARLLPWLRARKGRRFGIVMLDFYDAVPGLVEAIIGVPYEDKAPFSDLDDDEE